MVTISVEARIQAPAEKVWAQLTDWATYKEWSSTHTGFPQGGPSPLAVGSAFKENVSMMGMPATIDWTIVEVAEQAVLAIGGKGPASMSILTRYVLVPDGDATTLRIENEYKGTAVKMMSGRLKDALTPLLNASLKKLDALLA